MTTKRAKRNARLAEVKSSSNSGDDESVIIPSGRSGASLISTKYGLILYGGEYISTNKGFVFSDTWNWKPIRGDGLGTWKNEVKGVGPKGRVGHAACQFGDFVYMLGGEFATFDNFRMYRDFWRFNAKYSEWEELPLVAKSKQQPPCARSGHRMVPSRDILVVFGGYNDSGSEVRYLNDVYTYHPTRHEWKKLSFPDNSKVPKARSGMLLASNKDGVLLIGGYAMLKATARGAQGMHFSDLWWLNLKPLHEGYKDTLPTWTKVKRKKTLSRAGWSSTQHKNVVYAFGGVLDYDEGGTVLSHSFFYSDIWMIDVTSKNWIRCKDKSDPAAPEEKAEGEWELAYDYHRGHMRRLWRDSGARDYHKIHIIDQSIDITVDPATRGNPLPRYGASIAIQDTRLYLFGGTMELGNNKQIVFDDIWMHDFHTHHWKCLHSGDYWHQVVDLIRESTSGGSENESNSQIISDSDESEQSYSCDSADENDESSDI